MTGAPKAIANRLRSRRLLVTLAAFAGLAAVVLAFDSLSTARLARNQLWGLNALHLAEFERKLPARQATDWYIGVGPGTLMPEAPPPVIEPAGGIFERAVTVEVTAPSEGDEVRCSTDGSIPTQEHQVYSGPLTLETEAVLRCRTFRAAHQTSSTTTGTFLIRPSGALPILALTVEPTNLWNPYTGIYARYEGRGSEWERDAHVELFSRSFDPPVVLPGRVRIHGFWSREYAKKSFRFYFEPLAAGQADPGNVLTWPSEAPQRAVIFSAAEGDVPRDELFQTVFSAAGGITSDQTPAFLFLNGGPWGIYFMRERIDEDYLHRRFGPGRYDLLDAQPGPPRVIAGDMAHWNRTLRFFESGDFRNPAVLAAAAELIDIENFTDYWLFNIYAANVDWPHHNMNMFRRKDGEDGRWRWIAWDADMTFDLSGRALHHDTLAWATRRTLRHDLRFNNERGLRDNEGMMSSTLIARKLLENAQYRARFAQRMFELLDTHLAPERVLAALDRLSALLEQDLPADWQRWDREMYRAEGGAELYRRDLERVRRFVTQRPDVLRRHFAALLTSYAVVSAAEVEQERD